ncbi:MAG: pitrilysin family protein [Myxococcota bacterium]|nr:pitrilysin family protein [Myxococcota bacterium]
MLPLLLACLTTAQKATVSSPAQKATVASLATIDEIVPIPQVGRPRSYHPPEATQSTLQSGASLLLIPKYELPIVLLSIHLPGGYLSDHDEEWGRADAVAEMLHKSSGENTTAERSQKLRLLAASIEISVEENHTTIHISVHKEKLDDTLPLISDMLFRPSFTIAEWDQLVNYRQEELKQAYEDAGYIANEMQYLLLYPPNHIRHRLPKGTPKMLQKIDRESAQQWHIDRLVGSKIGITATGDINQKVLEQVLDKHFPQWPGKKWIAPTVPLQVETASGLFLIDVPGEEQSQLRVLTPAWRERDSMDALPAQTANIAMGGSFTSRLNNKMREQKGYTYGVRSYFQQTDFGNTFHVRTSVQKASTAEAIQDLRDILASAQDGFSSEELRKSRSTARADIVAFFETRSDILQALGTIWRYQRPLNDYHARLTSIEGFNDLSINQTAKYFSPDRGIMLVVGDAAEIEPMLSGMEYQKCTLENHRLRYEKD